MGSEISNIPSAGGRSKAGTAKKAKAEGTKPTENSAVSKKDEKASSSKAQPAAIVELSQKIVKKRALEQVDLAEGELQRYVAMLRDMPEIHREDVITQAKEDLASGAYGDDALRVVAEEIGRDLGIID